MTTLTQAFEAVERAKTPHNLFSSDADKAKLVYRDLAQAVHPDRVPPRKQAKATAAFAKLASLWDAYSKGDAPPATGLTISTRKRTYVIGPAIAKDALAVTYRGEYLEDGSTRAVAVKFPRSPRNSDLMTAEARALQRIAKTGESALASFTPTLIDSFRYRDADTKAERVVNVLSALDVAAVSLADVKRAYPDGIDIRDAAWMWRRLLVAVGLAHRAGVVHGAVLPEHVFILPEQHGLVLAEWCYSMVEPVDHVSAIVPGREDLYAPEVLSGGFVNATTDIYMATKTMESLLDDRTPRAFRAFIKGCTLSQSQRPDDAWFLVKELLDLLERHFGARKFRVFSMPAQEGV